MAAAIARAKLEWERTVDTLRDIVCLLDGYGRVVRANRAVERWGLGGVGEAIGRSAHELLHPGCAAPDCELAKAVDQVRRGLNGGPAGFEYRCADSRSVWNLSLRSLPAAGAAQTPGDVHAVLIVSDVSELHRARSALEKLNAGLDSRVRARTRELAEANRDLRNEVARREAAERAQRQSAEELARLSGDLIKAQESERHRVSVELHDSIGQALTGVKYSLERAIEMLRRGAANETLPVLQLALDGVRHAVGGIREIAGDLRPSVLDDMGASSAVAWSCRRFAEIYPRIRVVANLEARDSEIPDRLGTAVFRSIEELLSNVARHSQATEVQVGLRRDTEHVLLEVRDNGIGIPPEARGVGSTAGHGIRYLNERAQMTGGRLLIVPGQQGGAVASICWQLMRDEITRRDTIC